MIKIKNIPDQIESESVKLRCLSDTCRLLEQDYAYDLASSSRLLARYINTDIQLVGKDGTIYKGKLLSYDAQNIFEAVDIAVKKYFVFDSSAGWKNIYRPTRKKSTYEATKVILELTNTKTQFRYSFTLGKGKGLQKR